MKKLTKDSAKKLFIENDCSFFAIEIKHGKEVLNQFLSFRFDSKTLTEWTNPYVNDLLIETRNNLAVYHDDTINRDEMEWIHFKRSFVSPFSYIFITEETSQKLIELLPLYDQFGLFDDLKIYIGERDMVSRLKNYLISGPSSRKDDTAYLLKYKDYDYYGFIPMLYYNHYSKAYGKMMDFFINVLIKKYGVLIQKNIKRYYDFDKEYHIGYADKVREMLEYNAKSFVPKPSNFSDIPSDNDFSLKINLD